MAHRAALLMIGLTTLLTAHPASAAPVREGRSVAVAPGGYVRPLGHARHFARHAPHAGTAHGTRYADLKGDPGSGLGFYALPYGYRVGAWRYHQREASYPNPVIAAMQADAVRYYGIPGDRGYRYGVYDPDDGVGTPYFAGYYGRAGGDDEPSTALGRPYP